MAALLKPTTRNSKPYDHKSSNERINTDSNFYFDATTSSEERRNDTWKTYRDPRISTRCSTELKDLPPNFSMSKVLSPSANIHQPVLVVDGRTLDAVDLVCLALNEQARMFKRGCLYLLPSRANRKKGHPCDAIFVDEPWFEIDTTTWDKSNWFERLGMIDAMTKLKPGEKVIPLCIRILQYEGVEWSFPNSETSNWSSLLTPDTENSEGSSSSNEGHSKCHHYCSNSDPAMKPGIYQYSRPLEDVSTYLITYDSQWSTPFACLTAAAEHPSLCRRTPTPRDLSETFVRLVGNSQELEALRLLRNSTRPGDRAAELVMHGGVGGHVGVITALIQAWLKDHDKTVDNPDEAMFGRVTYNWQELKNIISRDGSYQNQQLLDLWSKMT